MRDPRMPAGVLVAFLAGGAATHDAVRAAGAGERAGTVVLPRPVVEGKVPLERVLAHRRSVREFAPEPLSLSQIGQLLWAAQGITHGEGHRTAPSAGARYPLETYVVTQDGVFHYLPGPHQLKTLSDRDVRRPLSGAAHDQEPVLEAPAVFVLAAVYERTESRYGKERAPRYVHMEAGHAAQNLLLQAVALDLGGVPVGAFDDGAVRQVLGLPPGERPLYLLPVGRPR